MTVSDFFTVYVFRNIGNNVWMHVGVDYTIVWSNDTFHFSVNGAYHSEKADDNSASFLHKDIIRIMLRKQYSPEVSNRDIDKMSQFLADNHSFIFEEHIHEAWVKLQKGELE